VTKKLNTFNEISLFYKRPPISEIPKIEHRYQVIKPLREMLNEGQLDLNEQVWVALLTSDNHLLGIASIDTVFTDGIHVNIRSILQLALLANAVNVSVICNHPSGNLDPLNTDIEMSRKIRDALQLLGIHLVDTVIITSESHRSYYRYL